jgi:tRNA nucleotidyltransferase (CCA-adding enzyme)
MSGFIPDELTAILKGNPALGRAYLVGGCVRDQLLGRRSTDFDVEVFGISFDALEAALASRGRIDRVGRSFGVLKLRTPSGVNVDFSVPRRDSKTGPGHKGFVVTFDPGITPKEAAARRDFTINAMMFDPRSDQLLDFFGGEDDLRRGVLRHTSDAFGEDPLRVLRGMQFAARFRLTASAETVALCRPMAARYSELAVERVREEWLKWAGESEVPSLGLRFLEQTHWISQFPELDALRSTSQDPEWHPEGDVFVHTCHCCDALVELEEWRAADSETRIVLLLAVLAHDFGKPATTRREAKEGRERIVSPGHDEAGVPIAEQFLERIGVPRAIINRVLPLVRCHMADLQGLTERSVRRLSRRLEPENIRDLSVLMTADRFGRPPRPRVIPESIVRLGQLAAELKIQSNAPGPILNGRDLVALGMPPGPRIGRLLTAAYEAQLDGQIQTINDAWQWLLSKGDPAITDEMRRALERRIAHGGEPGDAT